MLITNDMSEGSHCESDALATNVSVPHTKLFILKFKSLLFKIINCHKNYINATSDFFDRQMCQIPKLYVLELETLVVRLHSQRLTQPTTKQLCIQETFEDLHVIQSASVLYECICSSIVTITAFILCNVQILD